jgi:hypothetical protein
MGLRSYRATNCRKINRLKIRLSQCDNLLGFSPLSPVRHPSGFRLSIHICEFSGLFFGKLCNEWAPGGRKNGTARRAGRDVFSRMPIHRGNNAYK